jgi:hypothetical protein
MFHPIPSGHISNFKVQSVTPYRVVMVKKSLKKIEKIQRKIPE